MFDSKYSSPSGELAGAGSAALATPLSSRFTGSPKLSAIASIAQAAVRWVSQFVLAMIDR
jgi:hypothetical protein